MLQHKVLIGVLAGVICVYLLDEWAAKQLQKWASSTSRQFTFRHTIAAPSKPPLVWTSEELGVFHYRIPGEFNSSADGPYAVVMHIMLKVTADDAKGMKIRGAGFAEQVEPNSFRHKAKDPAGGVHMLQHLTLPKEMGGEWRPRFALRNLNGREHAFNVTHFDIAVPFALQLELSQAEVQAMPSAQLRVDDWLAWYEVSPWRWAQHLKPGSLVLQHRPAPLPGGLKRVVMVHSYLWGVEGTRAAPLVMHSLRYHLRLGVHSFFVYALSGMMQALLQHPEAVAAIAAGELRVVNWHAQFPQYDGLVSSSDQTPMLTHALLAHHNEDVLLLMMDLDEILVSFRPLAPLQLAELMAGLLGNQSAVQLGKVATLCDDCHGSLDSTSNSTFGAPPPELAMWLSSDPRNMSQHPLLRYRYLPVGDDKRLETLDKGKKSFCDPTKVLVYGVHHGKGLLARQSTCYADCPGSFEVEGLRVPPLMLLHLVHLHGRRGRWRLWDEEHRVLRTEWQWPLKP